MPELDTREYTRQELRDRGFKLIGGGTVRFRDGAEWEVRAQCYQKSKERSDDTPRQRRMLHLYEAKRVGETARQIITEIDLEEEIGADAFAQLPQG